MKKVSASSKGRRLSEACAEQDQKGAAAWKQKDAGVMGESKGYQRQNSSMHGTIHRGYSGDV